MQLLHTPHLETHTCRFVFIVPVWKINGSDFALDAFHKSLEYFKFLLIIPFVAVLWSLSFPAESEKSDSLTDFSLRRSKIKQIHGSEVIIGVSGWQKYQGLDISCKSFWTSWACIWTSSIITGLIPTQQLCYIQPTII